MNIKCDPNDFKYNGFKCNGQIIGSVWLIYNRNLPNIYTVKLRWLEPLWDHENLFETVRVNYGARSESKTR